MSMTLHFHPLSSFCWKALIGLYELDVAFEKHLVDLSNDAARAAFVRLWPMGKFPVLRDAARDRTVPESSIILEYIDRFAPGKARLIPADPDRALECRLRDRLYDAYIHLPLQKIVDDKLRPEDKRDPLGVERARAQMETGYAVADEQLRGGPWAMGGEFTLADCSALPALFYAGKVAPFATRWKNLAAYFERLKGRPSVARVLDEAAPYLKMFPG
jgi:glutathione S-transferase